MTINLIRIIQQHEYGKELQNQQVTQLLLRKKQIQAQITASSSCSVTGWGRPAGYWFIVKAMCPLSTVEKESFIDLDEGLAPGRTVLIWKTLSIKVDDTHNSMIDRLKAQMNSAEYVCTTADIHSTNNKSYLAWQHTGSMTTWLDSEVSSTWSQYWLNSVKDFELVKSFVTVFWF